MNTCKTIDYKISIYPSIVPHPTEVILNARIVLPNKNTLCVQESASRYQLQSDGERMVEIMSQAFTERISREISNLISNDVKQDINNQMY